MSPIERAARALCSLAGNPENATMDGKPLWQDYVPEARAVLQAIREPSEGMVATVVQLVGDPTPEQWALGERANAMLTETNMLGETACAEVARDWQAMIDAALTE